MNYFDAAVSFCTGRGMEIGALSNPAPLKAQVLYADVCDKAAMTSILCSLEGGPYYDIDRSPGANTLPSASLPETGLVRT